MAAIGMLMIREDSVRYNENVDSLVVLYNDHC